MSGTKRTTHSSTAPPHKKRRSPSTSRESSSGKSSSTALPARRETSSRQNMGFRKGPGSYISASDPDTRERRYETVIPDSQSPSPTPQQEEDVKPDPYPTHRSASVATTARSTLRVRAANGSRCSQDVDVKPTRFERSRSLSAESKPRDDELSRSLSEGSSRSGEELRARRSSGSDFSNFELDIKLEPGIDYRAPWMGGDRVRTPPHLLGFGHRPQFEPPAARSALQSESSRARSHAPSPILEDHKIPKEEREDHSLAAFGDMPPPRAPLSKATELDLRERERSVTASDGGHYPSERDAQSTSSRAGSMRSESAAQEEQVRSSEEGGLQRSCSPCQEDEEEYLNDWVDEGESEDSADEDQETVEMELEPTPEADPAVSFLSTFLPAGPQPIGVKARLQNELARSTALYTQENRVLPVPQPPRPRDPSSSQSLDVKMNEIAPTRRGPSPRSPSPSHSPSEPAVTGAHASSPEAEYISIDIFDDVDDEPDDYDEEENTLSGGGLGDVLAPQPHHEAPTENGTVHRWYLVLSAPQGNDFAMQEEFNYDQLTADVSLLEAHDIPSPHGISFLPPRRYLARGSDGGKLLKEMPGGNPTSLSSRARLDEMWDDLNNKGDCYKHRPRWEPKRDEWEETIRKMKKEGVEVVDLLDVLEELFARGRRSVDEKLLREIHSKNWLWFDQLRQLARVRKGYFALASDNVIIEAHTLHEELKSIWSAEVEAKKKQLDAAKGGDRDRYKKVLDEMNDLRYGKRKNQIDALSALAQRLRRIDE